MIVLIDNYDSFTFNLVHYLGELGAEVVVHRNDKITVAAVMAAEPEAIVLSPGPCTPNEAGICLDLIDKPPRPPSRSSASASAIRRSARPSAARWCARRSWCTASCPRSATAAPACSAASTAVPGHALSFAGGRARKHAARAHRHRRDRRRLVMGLRMSGCRVHGVQFHPESIASEHGHLMLQNFLDIAAAWNAQTGRRVAPLHAAE